MRSKKKSGVLALLTGILFVFSVSLGLACANDNETHDSADGKSVYVSVKNADNDIVNIRGEAPDNTDVLLIILNPGYGIEDIANNNYVTNTNVIQSMRHVKSAGGEYNCDIRFRPDIGGDFAVVAMYGNTVVNTVNGNGTAFEFYPCQMKQHAIDMINDTADADAVELILDEVMSKMSLYDDKLYIEANKPEIARLAHLGIPYEGSLDDIAKQLKLHMILAALNNGTHEIVFAENIFLYADEIKLVGTDEWDDYLNSISNAGKSAVNSAVVQKAYTNPDSISDDFKEAVYINCLMNHKNDGFGHIKDYLKKYRKAYEDAGLNISEFESSSRKNKICAQLIDSKIKDMETLAETFNKLLKAKDDNGSSPGRGSGGGSVGGKVTSSLPSNLGFVNPPSSSDDENIQGNTPGTHPFKDISGHTWAEEAIGYLWNQGMITGRGENTFAPGENVTRAEFVKMLVMGCFDEAESYSGAAFDDVSQDSWYFEYVSKAYSKGVVKGMTETSFMPDLPITREQAAAIVHRTIEPTNADTTGNIGEFADDASISDYARFAVYALRNAGIISGRNDNIFDPGAYITRAEAAKIIFASIKAKE